ncbi:TadE/TadG family type IV pilus assembly protein [Streptomyces sp. NPDC048481]|uniref:TadE/TadG family type IV pilus assembly protein n=1 Tax=Streptomyces sp. NPDC048481 TaxID=3365557 RepID=UPI0037135DF5
MSARRTRTHLAGDRGQVSVEFLGMLPTIIVTLVVVWQFVLLGYTYTLAGNAADEAVRAGTAAHPGGDRSAACAQAGRDELGDAWQADAEVSCGGSGFVTAEVTLHVPVLVPGLIDFPFPVRAHAGAVEEEDGD